MTPPPDAGADTAALTQRAQTLLDLGRPQEAVTALLQALARAPGDARALALLSLAHGSAGDHREALRWADRTVAAAPGGEWGHRLRAIHLLNLRADRDALRAAEEAVRLEPQTSEALQTLARAQLRRNRVGDAGATAERLRALVPNSYLAHEVLGIVSLRRGRWREAEQHCRRALALRPNSYYALNNLGIALSRAASPYCSSTDRRSVEAIDCLHRAIQVNPVDPLARTNLNLAVSHYLLFPSFGLLYFVALFGLALTPVRGMPFVLLGVGLAVGACAVIGYRRYQGLPEAIRDRWRRLRRERRRQWWETRAIRQAWVKRRR